LEAALEIDIATIATFLVVPVGPFGVGQLLPVGHGPREGLEGESARLVHEHGLIAGEGVIGRISP
jgi:hypothetical protein